MTYERGRLPHGADLKPRELAATVGSASVRFWFHPMPPPLGWHPFDPRRVARAALAELPELPGWSSAVPSDLRDAPTTVGPNSLSVRFQQVLGEHRVRPAEVVVNMSSDGRVHSVFRHYHTKLPQDLIGAPAGVGEDDCRTIVGRGLSECAGWWLEAVPELIVYQHPDESPPLPARLAASTSPADRRLLELLGRGWLERREYHLVWDLRVATRQPARRWRLLVDARTGTLLKVEDLRYFATGAGNVFDPNPMITSGNAALSWDDEAVLDEQVAPVTLEHLKAKRRGKYRLAGTHLHMAELNPPVATEPTSPTASFKFAPKTTSFLSVMTYFHIDRFRAYLQDALELTHIPVRAVAVDANVEAEETWAGPDEIRFGAGVGPDLGPAPDATDALVIIHEYGHVLQAMLLPDSVHGNEPAGISEGFGDFIAGVYFDGAHQPGGGTRGLLFPWSRPATELRDYRVDWKFGDAHWQAGGKYEKGQLWCATMFEVYRKLGGDSRQREVREAARDLAIRLFTSALTKIPVETPVGAPSETVLARAIEQADTELDGWWPANGLHRKILVDAFGRRDVTGYRPQEPPHTVDVYIDDGRAGGYGSDDGQDLFDQTLWKEDHAAGAGKDLWAVRNDYPSENARQAANPASDHVEPAVGAATYIYARVRNRGVSPSGPLRIHVYVAAADAELLWPDAWLPGWLGQIDVPDLGPGKRVVVGPFNWTLGAAGTWAALAVVESEADGALTQNLPTSAHVPAAMLVPFDNNIAMRRLQVT